MNPLLHGIYVMIIYNNRITIVSKRLSWTLVLF
jgi:hypothetical protein